MLVPCAFNKSSRRWRNVNTAPITYGVGMLLMFTGACTSCNKYLVLQAMQTANPAGTAGAYLP